MRTPRKGLVSTQIRWQSVSQEDLSPEPSHASTLISHFQPPGLRENAFLLRFKSPSLWYLLFLKTFLYAYGQLTGFPGGCSDKELTCQSRRHKRCGFDPWDGKIPWRRKWQSTPVFLPGESHGQKSLVGYGPKSCKESDITEAT